MDLRKLDLNRNGVPDFQDPAMALMLWTIVRELTRTFARPHTVAARAVNELEDELERRRIAAMAPEEDEPEEKTAAGANAPA